MKFKYCSADYTSQSPAYTSLINAFVSKTDAIYIVYYSIRNKLENAFKTEVNPKKEIDLNRLNDFPSSSNNAPNFNYFIEMYDRSGLPEVEKTLYSILGAGNDEIRTEMRKNIEHLSNLRNEIRNFYNTIYKGLFIEPKFSEINGFREAFDKFNKKAIKSNQIEQIKKNIDIIETEHRNIIRNLNEKLLQAPFSRAEYIKQYATCKETLNQIKGSKNDVYNLNKLTDVITELTTKLEMFKNDMSAASSIVNDLSKQRFKWMEMIMGVKIVPQNGEVRIECCGAM